MTTTSCCPALIYREGGAHSFAQALARPLTTIFGHSFDKAGKEFHPTLLNKIAAVALIIFLSPIVLPAISLGLLILSLSSAHKQQVAQKTEQDKAHSCDCAPTNSSASTLEAGQVVNHEGLTPDQRGTLLRAYTLLKNLLTTSSNEAAQKLGNNIDLTVITAEIDIAHPSGAIATFVNRAKMHHAFYKIDLTEINALLIELGQPAIETSTRERSDSHERLSLLSSRIDSV